MASLHLPIADSSTLDRVRALVLRHGWNATAYQIVNPGISHWLCRMGDAVVGYVDAGRVRVVAGAPVCAHDRLADVVTEFEAWCGATNHRACYFGAEDRLESLLRNSTSHAHVLLGAQPAWNPAGWPSILARRASLRAQLNRARNKGVTIARLESGIATRDALLRRLLDEWLDTRGLAPLHFLVEPNTLERLYDRRVFVARRGENAVAFLVASPVPCRSGWLIEQIVRGRAAVNGVNELLVDAAMCEFAAEGARYVTLGLSPLSPHAPEQPSDANPLWLKFLLRWVRAHGRRFYNFEGLDHFKAKFSPDRWEPVYAISAESRFSVRSLRAIAQAFSGGSPELLVLRSLGRAARSEARWAWRKARKRRTTAQSPLIARGAPHDLATSRRRTGERHGSRTG
jgi:phosphatidylglycerol lysyltransferase